MYLNFKCNSCEHKFTAFDEYQVLCPKCGKSDVQVIWDKDDIRGGIVSQKAIDKLNEYHNEPVTWWLIDDELVHCKASELKFYKEIVSRREGN
jgi:ribosomal protein S27E